VPTVVIHTCMFLDGADMASAPTIAVFAIIAETAVAVDASIQQGKAAKSQAKAQAAWNNYNAAIQEREALALETAGRDAELQIRRQTQRLQARQRAIIAAGGGEIGQGSPLMILAETAKEAEIEALTIRQNVFQKASAQRAGAQLSLLSGRNAIAQGKNLARAARLQAGGALLGGIGSAASQKSTFDTNKKLLSLKEY